MPDKTIGSARQAERTRPSFRPNDEHPKTMSQDDGITNPRDGRGPLRPRDDQAAKLPLRPPH